MGEDSNLVTIILTESQRVKAIESFGTPGGDNNAIFATIEKGAFQDYGRNFVGLNANLVVLEIPDTEPPRLLNASVDYGTGIIILKLSETLDLTPNTLFSLDDCFIENVTNDQLVSLTGATVTSYDSTRVTIQLLEIQRVAAIAISGT